MTETLLPTGTCFEDVTIEFIRLIREKPARFRNGSLFMVHGICLFEDGRPYSHAWIQLDRLVHFPAILNGAKGFAVTTEKEFKAAFRVQEFTRYLPGEAQRVALEHNDLPPPWESRYRQLCRDVMQGVRP